MAKKISTYAQKLKDPRWQKVRLQVMERDEFACSCCGDSENTLFVHHGYYAANTEPWEYPLSSLHTLCESCHKAADEMRERLKVRVGTMCLESQWSLLGVLESLDHFNYGDFILVLGMLGDLEIQVRLLREHYERLEVNRQSGRC
jgi:hypothetical protein